MTQPKVIVGGNLLVAGGSVIVPSDQDNFAVIPRVGGNDDPFRVDFRFESQPDQKAVVNFSPTGPHGGRFTLVNFDAPLGIVTLQPMRIAEHKGRALYVIVSVHAIGDKKPPTRLVNYTITLEGESDV